MCKLYICSLTSVMQRKVATFPVDALSIFKANAYQWARSFSPVAYLDSNEYQDDRYGQYEMLMAVGAVDAIKLDAGNAFGSLRQFLDEKNDWAFGYLGYDLKNEIEKLGSANIDHLHFPDLFFFQPEIVLFIKDGQLTIASLTESPGEVRRQVLQSAPEKPANRVLSPEIRQRVPQKEYLETIREIHGLIADGEVYELNFCQEFYAESAVIDPYAAFLRLNGRARAPFAAFLKMEGHYLLCASPERFLQKQGRQLVSQPIKGTIRRGATKAEDLRLRMQLQQDIKERAENVMIVDLVRNDLTRSAEYGTIRVEELFGIYPFVGVNQMISTVSAMLREGIHPLEAIRHAFPMGSMTGAPKVRAMQLIEGLESTRRGLYSGAIGYFTPQMDFDFNVVIRSILYHQKARYLSFQAGGAITYDSVPEKEYQECLLKAANMRDILNL